MDRVLVVHPGSLGDFIMSLPALGALKSGGFEVHVLLREPGKSFCRILPFIDGAYDFEFFTPERFGHFGYVFLFGDSWDNSQIEPWKVRSRKVFVGPSVRKARKWKVLEYLDAFRPLGICSVPEDLELGLSWSPGGFVSIHPGSGSPEKNWSLEGFFGVARHLKDMGYSVLFILGPAEGAMVPRVRAEGFPLIFGKGILDVARVLASSSLYIGNDSGVSHLSGLLGVPSLVIFKATDPSLWRPFGRRVYVVDLRFLE